MATAIKIRKTRLRGRDQRFSPGFLFFSIIVWIWALSVVGVFAWGVIVSFSDGIYYSADPARIIPKVWRFRNYIDAFSALKIGNTGFFGMFFNSVWISFAFMFMRTSVTAIGSYVVARYKFRGKKLLYAFLILQMMVPLYGQTTANYKLLANLGIIDSPLMFLAWGAGHGFYFLVMHSFFVGLSASYEEAGRLDGANEFTICFRLMMPMSKPILVAMIISTFTGQWNDYGTILIYLPSFSTLAAGVFRYRMISTFTLDIPTYFAGAIMAIIPPAILFLLFSETIMQNMTIGGLKG